MKSGDATSSTPNRTSSSFGLTRTETTLARAVLTGVLVFLVALVVGGCNYEPPRQNPPVSSEVATVLHKLGMVEGCTLFRFREIDSNKHKYLVLCHNNVSRQPALAIEGP